MKKIFLLLIFTGVLISLSSCGKRKEPAGPEDKIYVVADSLEYEKLYPVLDSVFGKIIYTPQPEKTFELVRKDYSFLNDIKDSKNILIIAPLNSASNVSKYINSILSSKVKEEVNENLKFVFNRFNLWSHNQVVMIMTSPTVDQLKANIIKNGNNLLAFFQNVSNKRLADNLYDEKYENKNIEAQLLKKYGWMIYVQPDYIIATENPEDKFVYLRDAKDKEMEKRIFIHWIDNASPEFLQPDSIINERNRLTEKYYSAQHKKSFVQITRNYKTTTEVNFHNKYALATQGLWEMNDKSKGGPFINYTFYDEKAHRIYMLDGAIYAPKYLKKTLIQQVDITLQSFMTEQQVSGQKKKELLGLVEKK